MTPVSEDVTGLLQDWSDGDQGAMDKLSPLVYNELRRLARRYLRQERPGHTLQSTALVHEAYLRLVDRKNANFRNRAHFFAVAAQLIRRILVDYARARRTTKRGGGQPRLSFDEAVSFPAAQRDVDLRELDDALNTLAGIDPQKARIVEMRFFGGLSVEAVAEVLEMSPRTVRRHWRVAKAWLHKEITKGAGHAV